MNEEGRTIRMKDGQGFIEGAEERWGSRIRKMAGFCSKEGSGASG